MTELEKLKEYQKGINDIEFVLNILNWELRTKAPKGSIDYLIEIKSELDLKKFKMSSNKEYEELLNNVLNGFDFNNLPIIQQRYIRVLKKNMDKNQLVPDDFHKEYIILCDKTNSIWEKAKEENNYDMFKPHLKKVIEMTKNLYKYLYPNMNVYDAMLNDFEIDMTTKVVDELFSEIKENLKPLVKSVVEKKQPYEAKAVGNYSDSKLTEAANFLLEYMGFDLNRGTLGIYPHGFMEKINNYDVRIAFKNTSSVTDFVSTIIHEGGHGIFEQNVDESLYPYKNNCVEYCNALHESQSRFYENILGRNINFWKPIFKDIKRIFDLDMDIEEFVNELNNVEQSLIRTESDELTYCFHIIMRYEIERDIFSGKLDVDDLPRVWNEKMQEYLGIKPETYSEGILQDVHWSEGAFGYFPSYLIGNIYDGMLKEQIEKELGSIDDLLASGNIKIITKWLNDNIHINGGAYSGIEVIERVCKEKIMSKPIIKYFNDKYSK